MIIRILMLVISICIVPYHCGCISKTSSTPITIMFTQMEQFEDSKIADGDKERSRAKEMTRTRSVERELSDKSSKKKEKTDRDDDAKGVKGERLPQRQGGLPMSRRFASFALTEQTSNLHGRETGTEKKRKRKTEIVQRRRRRMWTERRMAELWRKRGANAKSRCQRHRR